MRNERRHLHASTLWRGGKRQQRAEQLLTNVFQFAACSCSSSESLSKRLVSDSESVSQSCRWFLSHCWLEANNWQWWHILSSVDWLQVFRSGHDKRKIILDDSCTTHIYTWTHIFTLQHLASVFVLLSRHVLAHVLETVRAPLCKY